MFSNFGASSTFGAFSGSTPQTNVFGQPAQQQSGSLFGGGYNPPKPTFGSSFGSTTGASTMFGTNRLNNPTSTMFGGGQTATVSPFSSASTSQSQAGTSIPFNAITGTDTMMRNGVASPINTRHQCITCMKEYENKSLEELRLEDYLLNRKGPPQNAIFGGTNPQQATSIFSSINANTSNQNTFGQPNTTFGAPSTGTGLFSSLNQAKPATSFFSNQTSTAPFGGGQSAFSFTNPSTQPTSIFSSNNNTNTTPGTLGSSFTFQQPQQPSLTGGLFGQKPLTPATSTAPATFGGFGASSMTKTTGGIFNSTPPATSFGGGTTTQFGTGTGNMFGAQQPQQPKPFSFGAPFTSQPAVTSAFGGTAAPSFNFSSGATQAPSLGFGGTTSTFGAPGAGSTGFGSFSATPNFSLGNPTTSTGFGAPSFSFSTPSAGMGFSSFNQSNNSFAQPNQQCVAPTISSFATTPYKDSPLFYNLITNRSLDELTKPTNPLAQRAIKEASRRRHSTSFNTTGTSSAKNFTFPLAKPQPPNKKQALFDGFEDEPTSSIDIFSPKSSVKKLSLKSIKAFEKPRYSFPTFNRPSLSTTSSSMAESTHVDLENNGSVNNTFDESLLNMNRSNNDCNSTAKSSDSINDSYQPLGDNLHVNENSNDADGLTVNATNGSSGYGCNIICTRPGYYIHPRIEDLDLMTDEMNNCLVKGLIIGRHNYGEIRFSDIVNVAGINIDETVLFRHKEVDVYPDDNNKPPLGEGLNCPAEIVLERVWPIEKGTKDPIKSPARIKALNYESKLRRACARLQAEFISYNEKTGSWIFKVKHFSKYSCEPEENEDDDESIPPMKKLKGKGLGGIPSQQLGSGAASIGQQKLKGSEGSSTLTSMLMHKPWSGGDTAFSMETDMPVFHTLMSSTMSGKTTSSEEERDDYDDVIEGEIEHNPLTPSESEESEKEALKYDPSTSTYESILEACPSSPRVAMMKSMFSLFPDEEEDELDPGYTVRQSSYRPINPADQYATLALEGSRNILREKRDKHRKPTSASHFASELRESAKEGAGKPWLGVNVNSTGSVPAYMSRTETVFQHVLPEKSLFKSLKQKCVPGLKRGCCRVSFLRNGQMLCVTNDKVNWKGSDAISGRVSIYRKDFYDTLLPQSISILYIETINKQMDIELAIRKGEIEPYSEITQHLAVLDMVSRSQIELDNENSLHFSKLLQEFQVWNLCEILWPVGEDNAEDDGSFFTQREKLSQWFRNNRVYLFGWMDPHTRDTSPLELFKYGHVEEACNLAILQGKHTLALLLSQRDEWTETYCQEQLAVWTETGALEFIPEETKEIFRIFSGPRLPSQYEDAPMTNHEWLQNFAIHLWYSCPPAWSLKQVISSYLDIIRTQVDWSEEKEEFREENQPSDTNLFISLLKLYGSCDYPLKFLLDSRRNNLGSLEYKLPFLLMNTLRPLGYVPDPTLFENVCLGLAGELNTMGLYDWAIFVLQYLPFNASNVIIDTALQNYIRCEDHRQAEMFLAEKLDISEEQIFSLKALHSSYTKRPDHELWYLLRCKKYNDAYNVFAEKLFTTSINCKKNEPKILEILDELYNHRSYIPNWTQHGQLVHCYLALQKMRENDADATVWSINDLQYTEITINNFISSFLEYKPKNDSESAFLLELALKAQTMITLMVTSSKLRKKQLKWEDDGIEESNLLQLIQLPIPNEYMSSVQKFVATWMDF